MKILHPQIQNKIILVTIYIIGNGAHIIFY